MRSLSIFGIAVALTIMTLNGACTKRDAGQATEPAKAADAEPAPVEQAAAPIVPAKVRLAGFICGTPDEIDSQKVKKRQYTLYPETGVLRCVLTVEKAPAGGKFICGLRNADGDFGTIERHLSAGDSVQVCDFEPPTGGWQAGGLSFYTRQLDEAGNSLNGSSTGLTVQDHASKAN
jgi:hypothetical protein